MSGIAAVDESLTSQIDRDEMRSKMQQMSDSYTDMEQYISNLRSDLRSIESFKNDLVTQAEQGYEVGSSMETLAFQSKQLQTDLTFFSDMRTMYIRRTYADLWRFCKQIATNAAAIEPRAPGQSTDELAEMKMRGARSLSEEQEYSTQDCFNALNLAQSLLLELASDVASFDSKVTEAEARAARGFQVGNLVVHLKTQRTRLRTSFTASIEQIDGFLNANVAFAGRALGRIKMISAEIVDENEVAANDTAADAADADAIDA
jgi:hypothetical protein